MTSAVAIGMQKVAQAFMSEIVRNQIAAGIAAELSDQVKTLATEAQQSDPEGRTYTLTSLTLTSAGIDFIVCPEPGPSTHPVHSPVQGRSRVSIQRSLSSNRTMASGSFAYITGVLSGGEQIPLFRLRYGGSAHSFGFAIYSPARDRYEDAVLLTGLPIGSPQEALDTACTVHLAAPGHQPDP